MSPTPSSHLGHHSHDKSSNIGLSGSSPDHGLTQTGIIVIASTTIFAVVIALGIGIIWWRKRTRAQRGALEKRASSPDSLLPFAFHPAFGFTDMDKRASTVVASLLPSATATSNTPSAPPVGNEQDGHEPCSMDICSDSSRLESRPHLIALPVHSLIPS